MTLEDFLAPLKWTDEQVLRLYTQYAVRIEKETGSDKFELASKCNQAAKWLFAASLSSSLVSREPIAIDFSNLFCNSISAIINHYETVFLNDHLRELEHLEARSGVKTILLEYARSRDKNSRFLTQVLGQLSAVLGTAGIYTVLNDETTFNLFNGIDFLAFGSGMLAWSSAMYFRGSDPKLLDKKPFWRTATDYLKEKVSPQPTLVPVKDRTTLENYVGR